MQIVIKLFDSKTKYESDSWPSFSILPEVFEQNRLFISYARTEYHCKNCGVTMANI